MSEPAAGRIVVSGAAFGYAGVPVVSGIDLTVGPGDFVGVLGPNGAGKTTLFRGVLGLLPPLSGTVSRVGVRPGYVPQRDALDPVFPMTVREVVAMGAAGDLDLLGRMHRADRARVAELLEHVGLAGRAHAAFNSLSGGQRQRALIARALLANPNVLLLDEPTTGVDRPTQERILALLQELNQEGLAILLVSHELAATRRVVRSVVWVDGGKAVPIGGAETLDPEHLDLLFAGATPAGGPAAEEG